jgi:hypothetical protein
VFEVAARYQVALSGLTIANGNGSDGSGHGYFGGGIYNAGTLTISGCTLSSNGSAMGGAIYDTELSTLTVSGCTFSGNASGEGGAIMDQDSSTLTVSGCTFSGNNASEGGAIFNYGNATISDSTFSGNSAGFEGGAIWNGYISSTLNVSGCILTDNTAGNGGAYAAIYVYGGTVTISNTTFSGNGSDWFDYIVGPWIDGGGNTFGP